MQFSPRTFPGFEASSLTKLLSSFSHQDLETLLSTILITLLQPTAQIHQKQPHISSSPSSSASAAPASFTSLRPCSYIPLCTIYHTQTKQPIIRIISCDISTQTSSSNKHIQPQTFSSTASATATANSTTTTTTTKPSVPSISPPQPKSIAPSQPILHPIIDNSSLFVSPHPTPTPLSHQLPTPTYTFSSYYEYYLNQFNSIHDHFSDIGYEMFKLDLTNKQELLHFHTMCLSHFEHESTSESECNDEYRYWISMMIHRHQKAIYSLQS